MFFRKKEVLQSHIHAQTLQSVFMKYVQVFMCEAGKHQNVSYVFLAGSPAGSECHEKIKSAVLFCVDHVM